MAGTARKTFSFRLRAEVRVPVSVLKRATQAFAAWVAVPVALRLVRRWVAWLLP